MSLDVYLSLPTGVPDCFHEVCNLNVTHNLTPMARAAGIYEVCWRPEELGLEKASELIELLEGGLAWLGANREAASAFDSPNGWGTYDNFVRFVKEYLEACRKFPVAVVSVWR